jgi:hypothetical protein
MLLMPVSTSCKMASKTRSILLPLMHLQALIYSYFPSRLYTEMLCKVLNSAALLVKKLLLLQKKLADQGIETVQGQIAQVKKAATPASRSRKSV